MHAQIHSSALNIGCQHCRVMALLVELLLLALLCGICACGLATSTPVKLLVLVAWPSDRSRDDAAGLDLLTGGRVAVNEINNQTALLKDYHIELLVPEYGHEACDVAETSQGLVNFVQHSIYPPGQVLAVLGLYCSTSTKEISSLASHESVQLIQLSAANSLMLHPVGYPQHLWNFLSMNVYANMMVNLMDQFTWNEISIIYSHHNYFYGEIILDMLTSDNILFSFSAERRFHNSTLNQIREGGGRIIFVAADSTETSALLCRAAERGMLYPDYMWIVADHSLPYLENANQCDTSLLHLALNGSLLSHFSLEPQDKTVTLVNGDTYSTYESNYYKELDIVAEEYNQTLSGDHQYAGLLYDQVWGFALALNSSLPELSRHNLSVSDIGSLGYSKAKEILEKELSYLDYRGASGHIRFSKKQEVSTTIDMYQIINGKQKSVGNCTVAIENSSNLYCIITLTETPPSIEFDKVYFRLSQTSVIALTVFTVLLVFVITVVLVLFLYYRNRPEIKATSLKLSILQFVACYILCIEMYVRVAKGMNHHIVYCYVLPVLTFNGINIFLVTLFLKILRVYRIFHNKSLKRLNWKYSNCFLIFCSIVLSVLPNVLFVFWYWFDPKILQENSQFTTDSSTRYIQVALQCTSAKNEYLNILVLVPYIYISFFAFGNVLLATWNTKIYSNFKDTKKVNLVVAVLFIATVSVSVILAFLPISFELAIYYYIANFVYSYIVIILCLIIFVSKLSWMVA